MTNPSTILVLAVLASHVYSAPQFISFQDGKLGVNFGGYHAGIGIGGLFANGTRGGLYAEAGTPTGQFASAGLGGTVNQNGIASGGLFAGATAGGNYHASAGLSGTSAGNKIGSGFAQAQAGNLVSSSTLEGQTGDKGSAGYSGVNKVEVVPLKSGINTEVNVESVNEVQPEETSKIEITKTIVRDDVPSPQIVKEVYIDSQPHGFEKHIVHAHYKPRRAHFRKTAFLGGYIGGQGDIVGPVPGAVNTEQEAERRVDVGVEANAGANVDANLNGGVRKVFTKEVTVQKNPTFFRDIFDIPISTLKAVGNFLGNTASRTNISVQKSVHTESEPKHDSSLSSSSSAHITVDTPAASSFIDDIFSIPISALGAVNKFLENNVARKNVQVVHEEGVQSRVRRVPHGRRRYNQKVVVEDSPQ
ncbi:uncharacterized protein LOC119834015 isoform X2 [Zerene cesonia]|uniref:uncharacterized protein LOC119834015 isoform X2 n=1 Tax=Zerene cesonia TaxID=33412 RepID=UPI0018E54846|nr:uncharacterized protein LOC119834015 isoform X2 [Zerene cesonia]